MKAIFVGVTLALGIVGCSTAGQPGGPQSQTTAAIPSAHRTVAFATTATIKASAKTGPLHGKTIGIDPGHNGRNYTDPSYIDHQIWNGREWENCNTTGTSTDAGYPEAKFNFHVATYLRKDLQAEGAHVVMTRHNNHGVGPCVNKRAAIINRSHATVGIDIHGDGGPSSGRGFAILEPVKDKENRHVIGSSAKFGSVLRRNVLAGTPMPTSTYDGVNGVTHRDDLAGLNLTRVPLVLVECGNMRNSTDARLMTSKPFQQKLAKAMALAITRFARHG
ncbi:MAG TPA: N-acetylmuramoyl-L-alanine amidase [Mycobacteriales bacterium]|jgi:N-acetylmuramoyl-L-alanine amidase|nr:N-acetylmuramoyl-L-alanine amidase [Mycobacteriales bacterium]